MVSKISKEIEIPPGSDYFIRFDVTEPHLERTGYRTIDERIVRDGDRSDREITPVDSAETDESVSESKRPGKLCDLSFSIPVNSMQMRSRFPSPVVLWGWFLPHCF